VARSPGTRNSVSRIECVLWPRSLAVESEAVLAEADVYVQLSRHEGFGLSVVEAISSTLPAILSNAIGAVSYPEIADLPHVIVVPPSAAEAARAIARAMEQLPNLAAAALHCERKFRSFFSWDRAAVYASRGVRAAVSYVRQQECLSDVARAAATDSPRVRRSILRAAG
jgi:glycosyltransferase involved in cell wall biosynthesis